MSEVVVVARVRAKQGRGDEAEAVFRNAIIPTHAEQGCLLYALHREAGDPDHLVLVERWASRDDLEIHLGLPHLTMLREVGALVFDGPVEVTVLEPRPFGDAAKGSLAGA